MAMIFMKTYEICESNTYDSAYLRTGKEQQTWKNLT